MVIGHTDFNLMLLPLDFGGELEGHIETHLKTGRCHSPGDWNRSEDNFTDASADENEDAVRIQLGPVSPGTLQVCSGLPSPTSMHLS